MKNSLSPEQLEKRKKINKKILLVFGVIFGFLILMANLMPSSKPISELKQETLIIKDWGTATYEQKEAWLKDRILNPDRELNDFAIQIKHQIKKQFNYPEEVDFDRIPMAKDGEIFDAKNGIVFYYGSGTAKNAFGVKSKFSYSVETKIIPGSVSIEVIQVNEK